MKTRWKYGNYEDPESPEKNPKICYYKVEETLTWRFFIRIIQDGNGWFTPCKKCQEMITQIWNRGFYLMDEDEKIVSFCFRSMCKKCINITQKLLKENPLLIGNAKYRPFVELNRAWVEDDDTMTDSNKKEYNEHRHPAFRD